MNQPARHNEIVRRDTKMCVFYLKHRIKLKKERKKCETYTYKSFARFNQWPIHAIHFVI